MSDPVTDSASQSTSPSLVERVRTHDPEAWRRFVALYGPIVYRWSLRHRLQPHDAADVMQEVFIAVAQGIENFRPRKAVGSFRSWLFTVTRTKVLDHFRRERNESPGVGGTTAKFQFEQHPQDAEVDEPAETLAGEISHRAMLLIQNEFEVGTWKAFWAATVEGRAIVDIADDLGLTVAAVYKAKSRVMLRLRSELDGLLD